MPNTIILKKSSVAEKIPLTTDLVYGELALNYTDGKLYFKTSNNTIDYIANGGTFTNSLNISSSTVSVSTNTGALTVAGGVGIGGDLYVGGTINGTATNATLFDNQNSSYYLNYRNLTNKPISTSTSAPLNPADNDLWWDPDSATLFIRYSGAWVQSTPSVLIETSTASYTLNGGLTIANDLTVQGTLYETSDLRLKENIAAIQNPITIIDQLQGVEFLWSNTGKKSMGVIAQDLEKILPFLTSQTSEGIKTVNYTAIIGLLIEAIKELNKKIDKNAD